jgi:hypothetical protein
MKLEKNGSDSLKRKVLKVVLDESGEQVGIALQDADQESLEDRAALEKYDAMTRKSMITFSENAKYLEQITALLEKGDRTEAHVLIKKHKKLDELFLFLLENISHQKDEAKKGGKAKNAGLQPYKNQARRMFGDQKKASNIKIKQLPFAIEFVEQMKVRYESIQEELALHRDQLNRVQTEIDRIDSLKRSSSPLIEERKKIKGDIQLLKKHPKPVSPDTVVEWLKGL